MGRSIFHPRGSQQNGDGFQGRLQRPLEIVVFLSIAALPGCGRSVGVQGGTTPSFAFGLAGSGWATRRF
ncbi:hypothetical protein AP057_02005 [Geobacillus sp. Sah69]|nr:hypothetical protein AA906_01400 [Geobacillus stearothermophilus]KQC47442.1 hypothetical protein AP057_02005 [Geobacillus sp. Sah69]RLQ00580.1 hypothetical protein D9545_07720 [Geobacillus stearothermophilus]